MKNSFDDIEYTWWEKVLFKIGWYKFCNFMEDWVYPAYNWRNLLFHRYDRVKVPQIKAWEYADKEYLMFYANMQIVVDFIEKENPEKHICWYKDEDGTDCGHKYGENPNYVVLFPEYKDKWIMDIIKEIYHWWKEEYPMLLDDAEYLLGFWCKYFNGDWVKSKEDENGNVYYTHSKNGVVTTMEELEGEDINWDIIDKYLDRTKLFEEGYVFRQSCKLENDIFNLKQKYLHLCIEVRPYLWT